MNYTLFVDESGQSGIKKIRTSTDGGASPYMTLGAALVRNDFRDTLELSLKFLREDFAKPDLHCSRLNHNQLVRTAKTLSTQEFKAFGVVSLKATLGSYKDRIGGSHSLYYNKCAQYLLEKVGQFMDENSITSEQLSVVFEEGSFDYAALRKLISACRQNPMHLNRAGFTGDL